MDISAALPIFIVTFREGFEAALVVGIVFACLKQAQQTQLYRWVYSREPDAEEMQVALSHIGRHEDNVKIAYEDIVWALVNTKEFLFNH